LFFNLENASKRNLNRLAISPNRWNTEIAWYASRLDKVSNSRNTNAPSLRQLSWRHRFEMCLWARHGMEISGDCILLIIL
jgi:hypothetical protein